VSDPVDIQQPPPIHPGEDRSRRKGCLFWALVLIVGSVGLLALMGYLLLKLADKQVQQFTAPRPMVMPTPFQSEERVDALLSRVQQFAADLEEGKSTRLELTGPEIDVLIDHYLPAAEEGWRIHVELVDDTVRTQLSVPLVSLFEDGVVPVTEWEDRYLNGTFDFHVAMEDGALHVELEDVDVAAGGTEEKLRRDMEGQNLAEHVYQMSIGKWVSRLNTVTVKDGVMVLER